MTDAISGEQGAYVPCEELAAVLEVTQEGAISGFDSGYVAKDELAADEPAAESAAISGSGVGFVAKPCCDEHQTFLLATTRRQIMRWKRSFDGSTTDSSISTLQFVAYLANEGDTAHPPSGMEEKELRTFASHTAPTGTTAAILRCRVYADTIDPAIPPPVDLQWEIRQGTWGTGTPTWGDVGAVLASGTLTPDSAALEVGPSGMGSFTDVNVEVPIVDGLVQLVLAFAGTQTDVNALSEPFPSLNDVARYPVFVHTDGQSRDRITTADWVGGGSYYRIDFCE